MAAQRICSVDGCGKPHQARGFCSTHDYRMRKHGATEIPVRVKDICAAPGCGRFIVAGGLCDRHYRRLKAHGSLELPPRVSKRPKCSVEGCENTMHGLGLCRPHYSRKKQLEREISTARHGEGLAFIEKVLLMNTAKCIAWPFGSSRGYGITYVNQKNIPAHRYICERKHGPPPFSEAQAAHRCGNRICVNWRHVRWATALENNQDKFLHGTIARGEKIARAKLTEDQVRRIRSGEERQIDLAREFGVNRNTVRSVRLGRTWKHVD